MHRAVSGQLTGQGQTEIELLITKTASADSKAQYYSYIIIDGVNMKAPSSKPCII
jgi:hypothetical protein